MARRRVRVHHAKKEMSIPDPMQFLADTGLLFTLNRTHFHPLGLALTGEHDAATGKVVFCKIVDCRREPTLVFTPADFRNGGRKWAEYLEKEGNATMSERERLLGFVVQQVEGT